MARSFEEIFLARIRDLFKRKPHPSQADLDDEFRTARAQAGGEASGDARRNRGQSASEASAEVAASHGPVGTIRLDEAPWSGLQTEADYLALDDGHKFDLADWLDGLGFLPAGAIQLATWNAAFVNGLPDSAFACIDGGGTKDGEGKTVPRSLRHYPHHDSSGAVDLPHLRNALARVAQEATTSCGVSHLRAHARSEGVGEVAAADADELAAAYVSLRLDDGQGLPDWQVFHVVGDHGSHPRYGPIVFTQEDGEAIIRNFRAGTLGRAVPLDFRHATSADGEAGGWVDEFRWGRRGEGLPGAAEPSGAGPILYARLTYTDLGRQKLAAEHYRHQSPEYDRNYQGRHGAVALALACTNNPFLRNLRTLQGREPLPVLLDDGAPEEEDRMPDEPTTNTGARPLDAPIPASTPALTAVGGGPVSLEEFQALRQQLALANSTNDALSRRVEAIEGVRHTEAVQAATSRAIERGVPPSLVRVVGAVMLAHALDEPTTVRLSDDEAAPVNTYGAMAQLLEILPRVHLGRVTLAQDEDHRPGTDADALRSEAEQRQIPDTASTINAMRGIRPNGTH